MKKRQAKLTNKDMKDLLDRIITHIDEQNYGLAKEELNGLWEYFADPTPNKSDSSKGGEE